MTMDTPQFNTGPAPALPHNLSDLILAHAIRLAAAANSVGPIATDQATIGLPEPTDDDDNLIASLARHLLVSPDLFVARHTAIVHHPDWSLYEACAEGEVSLVKAWFLSTATTHILDSDLIQCITAASANGHVDVLDWLYKHGGRPFYYTCEAVDEASANGHVDVLAWWLSVSDTLPFRYSAEAMDGASANGEVDSLHWWLVELAVDLKYTESAMDLASAGGYVEVLGWWLQHFGPDGCKYSESSIQDALAAGQLAVLDWWWAHREVLNVEHFNSLPVYRMAMEASQLASFQWCISKLEPDLIGSNNNNNNNNNEDAEPTSSVLGTADVILSGANVDKYWTLLKWCHDHGLHVSAQNVRNLGWDAARLGRVDILAWLLAGAQEFGIGIDSWAVMNNASEAGHINVLDWCIATKVFDPNDGGAVYFTSQSAVDCAATHGKVALLDWWLRLLGHDRLQYTESALTYASMGGHVGVLEWFKSHGFELKYHRDTVIDLAAAHGHVDVLMWWHSQGLPFEYSHDAMDQASVNGHAHVLQWFLDSGLEIKYTRRAMDGASLMCRLHVLDWWVRNRSRLPDGLQFSANAVVSDGVAACWQALDWWRASGVVLVDQPFFDVDLADLEHLLGQTHAVKNILDAVVWRKANGYSVIANAGQLKRTAKMGQFAAVECLVDVVGIVPTAKLVAELEQSHAVPVHIMDWLKSRVA